MNDIQKYAALADSHLEQLLVEAGRQRGEAMYFSQLYLPHDNAHSAGSMFYKLSGGTPYSALELVIPGLPRERLERECHINCNGAYCNWEAARQLTRNWFERQEPQS